MLKVPKNDLRIEEDPFILLGYGMNSYFKIMLQMMYMCILISLVAVPLMWTYSTGAGLTGYALYSLGSLQGATNYCT